MPYYALPILLWLISLKPASAKAMADAVATDPTVRKLVSASALTNVVSDDVRPALANCAEPRSANAVPLAYLTGAMAREVEGPKTKPMLLTMTKKHTLTLDTFVMPNRFSKNSTDIVMACIHSPNKMSFCAGTRMTSFAAIMLARTKPKPLTAKAVAKY